MIETENIGYSISGKNLLDDISIAFQANEISMIIGPNGAGKSTLIKLLSRQISCTRGRIRFEGIDLKSIPTKQLAKIRAVLSQNIELAFPLTVEEVVMMGRYPHFDNQPAGKDQEICRQAMDFFKVDRLGKRNYLTLSGGEKQRVHFARVAAQVWPDSDPSTKILLLDEPLTYLDIYYQYEFLSMLKKLMQQQPMIVIGVLHDLNLAYKFADKVALLLDGRLLAQGGIDAVFTKDNIKAAFMMEPSVLANNQGERFLCF